jgi:hypothetical protein
VLSGGVYVPSSGLHRTAALVSHDDDNNGTKMFDGVLQAAHG